MCVIITGSASGLGAATAAKLANDGGDKVVHGRVRFEDSKRKVQVAADAFKPGGDGEQPVAHEQLDHGDGRHWRVFRPSACSAGPLTSSSNSCAPRR